MPKKKSKQHIKPSKEELEAKAQEAIEAEPSKEPVITPSEPKPSKPVPGEPAPSEPDADPSEEAKVKLKKKLSASARENQKIYAKNRVINKALAEAEDIPEPTGEELAEEFTDWDVMSDTEKKFAKETVLSRNWREAISKAKDQAMKIEKWNESVGEFIGNPETLNDNPELEGKTDEFKTFATQEANNNVPFKVLVGAFLHEHSSGKKSSKGRMFETGSGGSIEKPQPKSDKITLEEARVLKKSDYNKWKQMLVAGKIDLTI